MVESLITFLQGIIVTYGWFGVFVASMMEEVVAIIPSSVVQVGSGFLLLEGMPHSLEAFSILFFSIVIPVSLGVVVGSLPLYGVGYYLGKPSVDRFGKWFGVSWEKVNKLQALFAKGYADEIIVFLLRAIPIFPNSAVALLCGILRISLRTFVIYTFLGMLIRAAIQGYIGWQLGSLYVQYADTIGKYEKIGLLVLAIGGIVIYLWLLGFGKRAKIKKTEL